MDQSELRALLLGPQFAPRVEDIPTPQLLLDKGVPDGILRLVDFGAKERYDMLSSLNQHPVVNTCLLIAATLRRRDDGGDDGKGSFVMSPVDAKVLATQDSELFEALATIVKPFTRLDSVAQAVDAAKNDSGATPSNAGGSESPAPADSTPSAPPSQD